MYSAAKLKKMFHDLLDQPRREIEALRAQCAAQEKRLEKVEALQSTKCVEQERRIEKISTLQSKCAALELELTMRINEYDATIKDQETRLDNLQKKQRTLELLQCAPNFKKVPDVVSAVFYFFENKQVSSSRPDILFKDSQYSGGILLNSRGAGSCNISIEGVGAIDIFMFRKSEFIPDRYSLDWKEIEPFEFKYYDGKPDVLRVYKYTTTTTDLNVQLPDEIICVEARIHHGSFFIIK